MTDRTLIAQENAALKQQLQQLSRSLQEAEARYDAVFHSALSLLSICTTGGIVLDVNRAALQAIGHGIEDFVGRHLWETPWFASNPDEACKVEQAVKRHHGQYTEYESQVVSRRGDVRLYRFILRPYRSYVGSEARFLVLEVCDITHASGATRP